jgi:hypothetical protein
MFLVLDAPWFFIDVLSSITKIFLGYFDNISFKKRTPLFWNTPLYEYFDNETDQKYASYHDLKRELHIDPELYNTLYDYLGEDVATYVIDWFNSEFDTEAEHVTY